MMMNRLGIILIMAAIAACTGRKLRGLRLHIEELLLAEDVLRSLENEMKRSVSDMPTLFFALQARSEGREKEFYRLMYQELQELGTRSFFSDLERGCSTVLHSTHKGGTG